MAESRGPNSLEGKLNLCISGVQIQVFRFTFERLRTPAPRSTNWGVGKTGILFGKSEPLNFCILRVGCQIFTLENLRFV